MFSVTFHLAPANKNLLDLNRFYFGFTLYAFVNRVRRRGKHKVEDIYKFEISSDSLDSLKSIFEEASKKLISLGFSDSSDVRFVYMGDNEFKVFEETLKILEFYIGNMSSCRVVGDLSVVYDFTDLTLI